MLSQQILRTTRNSADVRQGKRDWFKFVENAARDETRVDIYDEIGWFGITSADFIAELRNVHTRNIALHLNSPGGDVFDGLAITNALKQHDAKVNVTVDGIAASIASVIAMAGDSVEMADGALMMIHEPFALVVGDSEDMRKMADALDKMGDSIADIYALRAGGSRESWRAVMADETWYTAGEAVDAGLADAMSGKPAAKNTFDLSIFRNYGKSPAPRGGAAEPEPVRAEPDWRNAARVAIATAELEVITNGFAH